ncbi:hypothetical protein Gotur_035554, partial [Gossypium turneri]
WIRKNYLKIRKKTRKQSTPL